MTKYDPTEIEPKWQSVWEKEKLSRTPEPSEGHPKKYILDMYPYPSGAVLHVGHMEGYVGTDVVCRYLRMKGFAVLHPMGWDAFGLPAENYAIKTGVPPDESTHKNIDTFRRQLKMLGLSYDWEREIDTSDPDYYKWTQWLFILLFKMGLAYKQKAPANWCPKDETVLANEQVVDGKCERCGAEVVQKDLDQWFFKITAYADALIDGLDKIDWPKATKLMQKNWIGRKEGLIVRHKVKDLGLVLDAFTAYPAWIWADTFFVISPEHPVIEKLVRGTDKEKEVLNFSERYKKSRAGKIRTKLDEKEGIFTGRYVIDKVTGRELPVWLANFAMMEFGTGMIRCSAHDPRDYEFATKYKIPLEEVVERIDKNFPINAHDNAGVLANSGAFTGRNINEKLISDVCDWIVKEEIGRREVTLHLRDWLVSRQRYWGAPIPMIWCEKCAKEGKSWNSEYSENSESQNVRKLDVSDKSGVQVTRSSDRSEISDNLSVRPSESSEFSGSVGWFPVPEEELPVELPTDVDFLPHGESPIARSKTFQKGVKCPNCNGPARREVDTMDTFVDSSWYFLRFLDPKNDKEFAGKAEIRKWMPVDIYVGGGHTVQHLLFARFFERAMVDAGLLDKSLDEPFAKLVVPGWILGPDFRKMSKRWSNVITPDEVVARYGADTMRIYEMFMAPFEVDKPWNVGSVAGVFRFVNRVYRQVEGDQEKKIAKTDPKLEVLLAELIRKVGRDIETFGFNTAVSAMMAFVNEWEKLAGLSAEHLGVFLRVLAPFAPHLAEELYQVLVASDQKPYQSVHQQTWPEMTIQKQESSQTIVVTVNGKPRATLMFSSQELEVLGEKGIIEKVQSVERVTKYLVNPIKKVVYVPGKIINFVV